MKKTLLFAAIAALAFAGCSLTTVETPEWRATVRSHWGKKEVDKLSVKRDADGSYSVELNGYKGDISEQFQGFTREMWLGLGILGRLVGSAVNPAVASVPLTSEAADSATLQQAINAQAAAKAAEIKAKAEAKAIKAAASASSDDSSSACADGSCGL